MKIYIASSWKNQHSVEMLTDNLRAMGHEVLSFIENNHGESGKGHKAGVALNKEGSPIPFEDWVYSERGYRSFDYDTKGAATSDLVIYVGPSGPDAWAEVGIASANNVTVFGLWAKGEPIGLMRLLVSEWFDSFRDLLDTVRRISV